MLKRERVILLRDSKWGQKYETKELKRGFVVNYLLNKAEILFYNDRNLAWVAKQKIQEAEKNRLLATQAQNFYQKINNFSLTFTLNKDEKGQPFGSVSAKEIGDELVKAGFNFQKSQLLDFQPLHQLGKNFVQVKISNNLIARLKITIT